MALKKIYMDISLFAKRAKQLLENCPVYVSPIDESDFRYPLYIKFEQQHNESWLNRRETIVKTMLLIKEFHGSDSPLYRWLDKEFENVGKCPVERVLSIFLEHLDTFGSAREIAE